MGATPLPRSPSTHHPHAVSSFEHDLWGRRNAEEAFSIPKSDFNISYSYSIIFSISEQKAESSSIKFSFLATFPPY